MFWLVKQSKKSAYSRKIDKNFSSTAKTCTVQNSQIYLWGRIPSRHLWLPKTFPGLLTFSEFLDLSHLGDAPKSSANDFKYWFTFHKYLDNILVHASGMKFNQRPTEIRNNLINPIACVSKHFKGTPFEVSPSYSWCWVMLEEAS